MCLLFLVSDFLFFFFFYLLDQRVTLSMTAFAQLKELRFLPAAANVHVGATLQLELRLSSLMPVPVRLEQLLSSVHFSHEQPGTRSGPTASQWRLGLGPDGTMTFPSSHLSGATPGTALPALELYEMHDRSPTDNTLTSSSVACKNMHMVLRGSEGTFPLETSTTTGSAFNVEPGMQMLKTKDVTLQPGINSIVFNAPVRAQCYVFGTGCAPCIKD